MPKVSHSHTCQPISRGRGHSSGRYIEQLVEISE